VRVSTLLGEPLPGKVSVVAESARHLGDDAVVLSKKAFTPSTSAAEPAQYELDFLKAKPARGFYRISVGVTPQQKDKRLIGLTGAEVGLDHLFFSILNTCCTQVFCNLCLVKRAKKIPVVFRWKTITFTVLGSLKTNLPFCTYVT